MEYLLNKKFPGAAIHDYQFLSEPERRNVIIRIWIKGDKDSETPSSIILKQSLPSSQQAIDLDEYARFTRDWTGLEFVNEVAQDQHFVPRFYGGDREQRFILLEDLGSNPTSLVDSLLSSNKKEAENSLERFMKALAKLHALTYAQSAKFDEIKESLSSAKPSDPADTKAEMTYFLENIDSVIDELGITIPINKNEIEQILRNGYDTNGPFSVLTHGDVAPDNMFDRGEGGQLQLIDFEACKYRNALLDATHLRMSMPTAWCAKSIPEDIIDKVEEQYREILKKHIPAAKNDKLYQNAYTDACAYYALHAMAIIGKCLNENPVWGTNPVQAGLIWDPGTNLLRSRVLSRLETFIKVAEKYNLYPDLRQTANNLLEKLNTKWPKDKPLEYYPAFREGNESKHKSNMTLRK